jgi:hypothetical protein
MTAVIAVISGVELLVPERGRVGTMTCSSVRSIRSWRAGSASTAPPPWPETMLDL